MRALAWSPVFRQLTCRCFGHRLIEVDGGTRLRCLVCDFTRVGRTPKEHHEPR